MAQSWHIVYMHPLPFGYLCHLFWPEGTLQQTIISHLWNRKTHLPNHPEKGTCLVQETFLSNAQRKSWFFPVDVPLLGGGYPIASRGFFRQPPPKKNNGFPTSTVPARRRRRLRRLDFNHCWLGAGKSVGLGCRENDMVYIYIYMYTYP